MVARASEWDDRRGGSSRSRAVAPSARCGSELGVGRDGAPGQIPLPAGSQRPFRGSYRGVGQVGGAFCFTTPGARALRAGLRPPSGYGAPAPRSPRAAWPESRLGQYCSGARKDRDTGGQKKK